MSLLEFTYRADRFMRLGALVILVALTLSLPAHAAVQWRRVATVNGTLTNGQICYTNGTDILCDTNAPTLSGTNFGIGTTSPSNALTVNGTVGYMLGTDLTTTGSQNDVAIGMTSAVRYNGAATATFTGIAAGANGQILYLHNPSSYTLTLANQSASSSAANRIVTGTGADLSVPSNTSVTLQYDSTTAVWRVTGSSNSANTLAAGTAGQVQFNGGTNLNADSNFFWDNTNKRLGIGSTSPTVALDVVGKGQLSTGLITPLIYPAANSTSAIQFDKADGTTNIVTIDTTNSRVGIGTNAPGSTLTLGGQESWITGLGAITQLAGPSDSGFKISATSPIQQTASVSGNGIAITASNATAGSSTIGAASGGAVTVTAGDAKALTSGNAVGGAVSITAGKGYGNGGGGVNITGGSDSNSGGGGTINITAGQSGANSAVSGGGAFLIGGAGNSAPSPGGVASVTSGAGGSTSVVTGAAGNSGTTTIASGVGGTNSDNSGGIGGSSGIVTIKTGAGGNATGSSGVRTGGNSGNLVIQTGTAGTGATANGVPGTLSFGVGGATYMMMGTTGLIGIGSTTPATSLDLSQMTDAVALPSGTTGQRPTGTNGMVRYNSTLAALEGYINGAWTSLLSSSSLSSGITLGTSASVTNPQKSGDATTGLYSDAAGTVEISSAGTQTFSSSATTTLIPVGSVGIGTTAPTGILDVRGGTAAASTNGVNINLIAQNAGSGGNKTGGGLTLTAGTGAGTSAGGSISLTAGTGGSGNAYVATGGNITITAGASGSTTDLGGNVVISGGAYGGGSSYSGSVTIQGGAGQSNGAGVNIYGSNVGNGGMPGTILIQSAPTTTSAGYGGTINIFGSNGANGGYTGGNIAIKSGNGNTGGAAGTLSVDCH